MKLPLSWLQTFFEEPLPEVGRLVDIMDGLGLAVENVSEHPGVPASVVVADVLEVEPIEGSEHLKRTVVTDGTSQHQVVCGAPVVTVGMRTALALPGASLPAAGSPGEPLVVGQREMLGVVSNGMLCSPRELGLYDYAGGLIVFGEDAPLGGELKDLWEPDTIIEVELTPNRADAFSLLGIARDVAAKLGVAYFHPAHGLDSGEPGDNDGLSIEIADEQGCPRFTLRGIRGVKVLPSPIWLQRRLGAIGLRPRNNLIDVTNFVTFELGQPSHAYDLAKLGGGVIQVRRARPSETLELLTEEVLELDPADLLIATPGADGESVAIGLAGVMGGRHDSVSDATTDVALEVANFDPVTVRRTAQRHKLITDARTRFERGVDPNLQVLASARAAALIAELSGGTVDRGISSFGADIERPAVAFRPSRVQFLMDFDVPLPHQRLYLERLGCQVTERGADDWLVTPPSWRYDMTIEEDVVEEVARLHGYEHIGETVPDMHFVPSASDPTHRELKTRLAAVGLQETISYVFTGEEELDRANAPAPQVFLSDPQGVESGVLRTALYPGLLAAAVANRRLPALGLFEVGRVFLDEELERMALLTTGARASSGWGAKLAGDFFSFKGILESMAELIGAELSMQPVADPAGDAPYLHPGVAATVSWNGRHVGYAGRLHPEVAARYELGEVYLAELALPLEGRVIRFEEINRQPYAERDLAIIAPTTVSFDALRELCADAAGPLLLTLEPFDVYQGGRLEEGTRSIALRFRFRAENRALTDGEVDGLMQNVIRSVKGAGYDVRA